MTTEYLGDNGWLRHDPWQDTTISVHVISKHDSSPRWDKLDHYDAQCAWCWLNITHSTDAHLRDMQAAS